MEEYEPAEPIREDRIFEETPNPDNQEKSLIENKVYKLNLDKDIYLLTIETYTNGKIDFKLHRNEEEFPIFTKTYTFEEILLLLYLFKEQCNSISKVLRYIDTMISKNRVTLIKENKKMRISIKKHSDFIDNEMESILELDESEIKNEDLIKKLLNDIKELKSKGALSTNNQGISNSIKDNEEMKTKINFLIEENDKNKKEIIKLKKMVKALTEEKNEEKKQYEEKIKLLHSEAKQIKKKLDLILLKKSNDDEFENDPNELKFKELLTNNHSGEGLLANFAVYTGLKDDIEYLVYNNKLNYNLEVMRIRDKYITYSLKGHNKGVSVIKYFLKDNKDEYLLSCEKKGGVAIIWEIQNKFNIINIIQEQCSGNIYDALLLFNIYNKDLILISSDQKEAIKLCDIRENQKYYNINGTEANITNFMLPWIYNNNYYIIKFYSDISIHNIFCNECYAKLTYKNSKYYCGYIYNNNYLCTNDRNNRCLRIWDLINKNIFKEIKYDLDIGREIVPWNHKFTIISCSKYFAIVDIENGKITKKILLEKTSLGGVKKAYLKNLGECIIISDFSNNIKLFCL